MKSILVLLFMSMSSMSFACPEFAFCQGEQAISNDGYLVTITSMVSNDTANIQTTDGQVIPYATKYLAKMKGCNSAGLCVGDLDWTADDHLTTVVGVFGCGSTDAAITTSGTPGGYLRYQSQYLTKANSGSLQCM